MTQVYPGTEETLRSLVRASSIATITNPRVKDLIFEILLICEMPKKFYGFILRDIAMYLHNKHGYKQSFYGVIWSKPRWIGVIWSKSPIQEINGDTPVNTHVWCHSLDSRTNRNSKNSLDSAVSYKLEWTLRWGISFFISIPAKKSPFDMRCPITLPCDE